MFIKKNKIIPQKTGLNNQFKQNDFLKFNIFLFVFIGLPLLGVGSFNMFVDPYGVYNKKIIVDGLNHYKPNKENNDRLYKAVDIINLKPNTILLGSSRIKRGLDPNHQSLESLSPVYNLGLNGANIYELRRYLEHTLANNKNLKRVILGLDFFMFNDDLDNQASFAEYRLEKKHIALKDFLNTTLSLDTLEVSKKTIKLSSSTPQPETNTVDNGFLPYFKKEDGNIDRFQGSTKLYFRLHSNYQLSERYKNELKKILSLCKENNIELIVYFSPSHAIRLESIYATGKWSSFEAWKRQIVELIPAWDFSNYNSITTEPLEESMSNYVDESHYTKPIGDLVLNRILGYQKEKVPQDFGILLTSNNVDEVLIKNRLDRKDWAKANPQEVEFVKKVQSDYLKSSQDK